MNSIQQIQNRGLDKLKKTFDNLERIRIFLNLNHNKWADIQGITEREYNNLYLRHSKKYPFKAIMNISNALNILPENIYEKNKLDIIALAKHFDGDTTYLPEKYTLGAFSTRITMKNMLECIENKYGVYESSYILKLLQVHPFALEQIDQKININFAVDILKLAGRGKAEPAFFRAMGARSISRTLPLPFAEELRKSKTIPELYKSYLEDKVKHLEKNSLYRFIPYSDERFIVEAKQSQEVMDALKNKKYGSSQICEFKTGGLMTVANYANFPSVHTEKISCIHKGDSICRWSVYFNKKATKQPSPSFHF